MKSGPAPPVSQLAAVFALLTILVAPAATAEWREGIPLDESSDEHRAQVASQSAEALMTLMSEALSDGDSLHLKLDPNTPPQSGPPPPHTKSSHLVRLWWIPFVPHLTGLQGFFSIENDLLTTQNAVWLLVDERGDFTRLVNVSVPPNYVQYVNSYDLLRGNTLKGVRILETYKRDPVGAEYAVVGTRDQRVFVRAYLRTSDGFVTGMSRTAARFQDPDTGENFEEIAFFNPARNTHIQSVLRVINVRPTSTILELTGIDSASSLGQQTVRCRVAHREVLTLSAVALERGASRVPGCTGRWGTGVGKWQIQISSTRDNLIGSYSLLYTRTGQVTNLSNELPYSEIDVLP